MENNILIMFKLFIKMSKQHGKESLVHELFDYFLLSTVNSYHYLITFIRNISFQSINLLLTIYNSALSHLVSLFNFLYTNYIRNFHTPTNETSETKLFHIYWIAYCTTITAILLSISIFLFRILKRKYQQRIELKSKQEKQRQQRLATLYEILVSERQFCEYLRFLHDQYYLPLEKGDSSKQLELNSNNLIQSLKESVVKNIDSNGNEKKERNVIDFISIHKLKPVECLLIPSELENIILLNSRLLTSLESEILGWHTKDRLMYNIYRYSVRVIGNIFSSSFANNGRKSQHDNEKQVSFSTTPTTLPPSPNNSNNINANTGSGGSAVLDQTQPVTPTSPLTKKPLPMLPGGSGGAGAGEQVDNFGYNLKSVREQCNILANCFKKEFLQMFIMYAMFICKFNECRMNINELVKEYPQFADHLKKARTLPGSNSLDLMSFIVMVPQRLPRYVLFLKQLAKFTNLHDPQFMEIEAVIKEIESITFKVNACVKDYQNQTKVITVKDKIVDLVPSFKSLETDFVQPGRRSVGSFKLTPYSSMNSPKGEGMVAVDQTPRTQLQTVEVHVFTDLTIVLTSKPRVLPTSGGGKAKEEKGFFGFFTPRNKEKRNSLSKDQNNTDGSTTNGTTAAEDMIYEVYYCENSQISMFSQAQSSDCLILELNKSKYFTNNTSSTTEEKSEKKEKKNTSQMVTGGVNINNSNNKSKLFHLDRKDEHTKNYIQTFEKLSGQNKNTVFSIVEEGLMSNSKLLTFMASYINNN